MICKVRVVEHDGRETIYVYWADEVYFKYFGADYSFFDLSGRSCR